MFVSYRIIKTDWITSLLFQLDSNDKHSSFSRQDGTSSAPLSGLSLLVATTRRTVPVSSRCPALVLHCAMRGQRHMASGLGFSRQLPLGSPGHVHVDLRQTMRQVAVTLHLAPPGQHKHNQHTAMSLYAKYMLIGFALKVEHSLFSCNGVSMLTQSKNH